MEKSVKDFLNSMQSKVEDEVDAAIKVETEKLEQEIDAIHERIAKISHSKGALVAKKLAENVSTLSSNGMISEADGKEFLSLKGIKFVEKKKPAPTYRTSKCACTSN